MACNGELTPIPTKIPPSLPPKNPNSLPLSVLKFVKPPNPNFFLTPPPSPHTFYSPFQLETNKI